ncbi:alpha/beta-hydrolase [Neolentinus lepideus HHB14362 ss-1]|uniref:Alpha/beta-hydrolase n=1 Tax=Neolentinus lepideus HHB14362 ss-1 TaxID=1314782 RepID=A0A165P693_9AGAM|nr:alpha/beta-hydrolase [Neolentinus lepideus HHB14362 ss-1]
MIIYDIGIPTSDPVARKKDARRLGQVWIDGVPEDLVVGEIAEMAQKNNVKPASVAGSWAGKRNEAGEYAYPALLDEKILYFCHGGSYLMGTAALDDLSSLPARTILEGAPEILDRAFGIEYRLCSAAPFEPANPFPAALLDALAGYRYLVSELGFDPQNIVVAGDSAGGNLSIVLIRYLTLSSLATLPPPRPDGHGVHPELHNPWISPASLRTNTAGAFQGLPPVIIITGSLEQTLDPVRTFRDRLVEDNGEETVKYIEYPEATHDFLLMTWHEPERSQATDEIRRWLETLFKA